MEDRWNVSTGNARYLDFPVTNIQGNASTVAKERPFSVSTYYNNYWLPVEYGIGIDEYNCFNSDLSETGDPVQRWRFAGAQLEIWPIPNTAQTLRLSGVRELNPLLADTDTADLDDLLLSAVCGWRETTEAKTGKLAGESQLAERAPFAKGSLSQEKQDFILGGGMKQEDGRVIRVVVAK